MEVKKHCWVLCFDWMISSNSRFMPFLLPSPVPLLFPVLPGPDPPPLSPPSTQIVDKNN